MKEQFILGVSKKNITPPLGTPLYGYPKFENRKATSVHDDLHANVAVFGHGTPCAALISMELLALEENLTREIASLISKETKIPAENIVIASIHNHSGPCTKDTPGWGSQNRHYIDDILITKTLEAVKEAVANIQPALLGIGRTESLVGINRRQISPSGTVTLGQNPYGCFDPEMTVLSFVTKEKKPILTIAHYGAHATSAGAGPEISRDWPGVMVDRLEAESGAMAFFINGAEGDVGPRLSNGRTTGDFSHTEEIGGLAAIDALRAYKSIKEYREVDFRVITDTINIPYRPMPTREELVAKINELEGATAGMKLLRLATYKEQLALLDSKEELPDNFELLQTLFAFNSLVFVPFPFEVFSEITVRLKQYSPYQHTLSMSNTNGYYSYLPSHEQLSRGGYEVEQFNTNPRCLVENTDDIIINENLKLMDKIL